MRASTGTLAPALVEPLLRASDALRLNVAGGDEPNIALIAELTAAQGAGNGAAVAVPPSRWPSPRRVSESRSIRVPAEKIDTLLDLVGETVLHRRRLEHELGARTPATVRSPTSSTPASACSTTSRARRSGCARCRCRRSWRRSRAPCATSPPRPASRSSSSSSAPRRSSTAPSSKGSPSRSSTSCATRSPTASRRPRSARWSASRSAGAWSCAPSSAAARSRSRSPTTAAASPRRRWPRRAGPARSPRCSRSRASRPPSEVSGIAGRGVGLDAVREQVEAFGGSIEVRSEPAAGTQVILRLPLALALIDVLLVERAGNVYGFPLASVEEALSLGETLSLGGPRRDRAARPLDPARRSRGAPGRRRRAGRAAARRSSCSPPRASGSRWSATRLLGKEEVVVKSLGPLLASLSMYLGAAILGDGRIALLVDPAVLVRASAEQRGAGRGGRRRGRSRRRCWSSRTR